MPSSSFCRCCFWCRPLQYHAAIKARLASSAGIGATRQRLRRARGFDAPEASTRQCKNKGKKSKKSTYALIEREDEMFRVIV